MKFIDAGRISFAAGLQLQERQVERCLASGEEAVFLLEHEAVYTIGRRPDKTSLGDVGRLPFPVHEINRGGQATFHGPGQLVAYPVLNLNERGRDLHRYLRELETVLINLLAESGLEASRVSGKTGAWVQGRKIASIGVGVRRWISMHGLALNVGSDLSGFAAITPCGLPGVTMTSLSRELGREVPVEFIKGLIPKHFGKVFPDRPSGGAVRTGLRDARKAP
ncbi:MAG TPA: lipoyl(octanoyl) transferase LipB [Chthoniobacterales bacterium]